MSQKEHKEWVKENTLTTPEDRDTSVHFQLDQNIPELTPAQTAEAMTVLNNTSFVERFPAVERRYADPKISQQDICLISFVPAKGAKPNEKGVFGFAKVRGSYPSEEEANQRAEDLIRKIDSYHQIYHAYVGRPFPLTISSDYSKEVTRIDLRQEVSQATDDDVKRKREREQKDIEEIKQKEQNLLEDVKKTEEDKDDRYTTLRVKKAQLTWTYAETEKKMKQMCGLIATARKEIEELDKNHPELKEIYYNKYMEARRQAGLTTERAEADQSFMKYLVEDLSIPAVDAEYNRLYGE